MCRSLIQVILTHLPSSSSTAVLSFAILGNSLAAVCDVKRILLINKYQDGSRETGAQEEERWYLISSIPSHSELNKNFIYTATVQKKRGLQLFRARLVAKEKFHFTYTHSINSRFLLFRLNENAVFML